MKSLLIVEDEQIVALSLKLELEQLGYFVVGIAATEEEAVTLYDQHRPGLVLMDINLESGGSGINAAKKINVFGDVPIIYITAYASDDVVQQASQANPIGYIVKPYNLREVKAVIETAFYRFNYEKAIIASEAKLKLAMQAAELSLWEFNPDHRHFAFSGTEILQEYFGKLSPISVEEFVQLVDERDRGKIDAIISSTQKINDKVRIRSPKTAGDVWFEVYASDVSIEDGNVRIGSMKDVTSLENYIKELKLSGSIYSHIADGIVVFNKQAEITRANPAFCKMVGREQNELAAMSYLELAKRSRAGESSRFDIYDLVGQREEAFETAGGELFYAITNGKLVEHDSQDDELVMIITDITDIKLAEKKLRYQAYRDELTGLYNRAYMNRAFDEPEQYFDSGRFTLLFIDLDSFKLINDTYGHHFGDNVLSELAWRLKNIFRESDRVVRHGGDEFVVMVDGDLNESAILPIVNALKKQVSKPIVYQDITLTMTCSIGVALWDEASKDISELMKRADIAMYRAKKDGKNTHIFYSSEMGDSIHYQLFLEQGLRRAIDEDKLQLWFQPIVDASGNVVSAEGLCRWQDQHAGFVPPGDFIQVAEASWLIFPLGEQMLRKIFDAQTQLQQQGINNVKLALNLSAKQLAHPLLFQQIMDVMADYNVPTQSIALEITETAMVEEVAKENVAKLQAHGFSIALDDFGRGYSSLEQLQQLPIDVIKIDKVFVDNVLNSEKAKVVCDQMIDIGEKLGFSVVVEGIETKEQSEYFAQNQNIKQQGYWHSKAIPLNQFINLVQSAK